MHSSLGAYTKGLDARLMMKDVFFLLCCIPVLLAVSFAGLRKQEK
jgi:ribosome-dependent ATPase